MAQWLRITCNVGDVGLIPGSGRSPGEGNGNPLKYSYLGNPMDRGAWWATVQGLQTARHDLVTKQQYSTVCLSLLLLSVLVVSNGKNHYQIQWYEDFPPIFSSKSLIVSGLTFRVLIHFELVLCKFFFFFLHMDMQFSQHHLLKRLSCPHCVVLAPLQKLTWPYTWGFIYGIFILFHWLICLSAFQSHTALITVVCNMTWN